MKRILDAIKGEVVVDEAIPFFMEAFEALVKTSLSQEVMRALSLFVTYAFHSPAGSQSRTPRAVTGASRGGVPASLGRLHSDTGSGSSGPAGAKHLPKKRLGTRILAMYSDILCEKGNLNHIKKFARTVTNKVCFRSRGRLAGGIKTHEEQ